jgi:glutathione S-transferase
LGARLENLGKSVISNAAFQLPEFLRPGTGMLSTMTLTLNDSEFSGHAHKVRLLCGLLNLDPELKPVDMRNRAQKTPEYLRLNPFGQVPVLQDGDVIVRDSNAILLYLAETYDTDHRYLPADPVARARVYEWLATAAGPLYLGPARARVIKAFGREGDYDQARSISESLLAVMDAHLSSNSWLVDDGPTLADVACYSYIAVADEGGIDLERYGHVRAWLERFERLEGFVPMPRLPKK